MKFIILKSANPYYNLAVEQYFFEKTQDDVFILWQNEPSVIIGKNQNIYSEINFDFVREKKIHIVRRITGGGAVYHDLENINYSFISACTHDGINFAYFTEPIIDALCALGVNASLTGRNDIEVEGKKISGNAQCTKNGRTLHHGTLLFDTDLDMLSKALLVDEEKIKSKAIKSTRARVANLKDLISIKNTKDFIEYISCYIIKRFSPEIINIPNDPLIAELEARNKSVDWIFPKSKYLSSYILKKKKKFDFGLVEVELLMEGDVISNIEIFGDFFGSGDLEDLYEKLKGKTLSDISEINIDSYISGMTNDDFSSLISN